MNKMLPQGCFKIVILQPQSLKDLQSCAITPTRCQSYQFLDYWIDYLSYAIGFVLQP